MSVSVIVILLALATISQSAVCPSSNRKVIYLSYADINWGDFGYTVKAAADSGFNVLILSFYITTSHSAYDSATAWESYANKQSVLDYIHSKGACLLLSAGGANDLPYSFNASSVGKEVAQYAVKHGFDGIDFDFENIDVGFKYNGIDCAKWLIECTNGARSVLGNSMIITHAPQAPYFGRIGGSDWTGVGGGYTAIESHSEVDWYNVQFYNQGVGCYEDYKGLFEQSCSNFKHTSVKELIAMGIPAGKIVVGKPVTTGDANNGFISASQFGNILRQGKTNGIKFGGYMGWKWETQAHSWASQIGSISVVSE